MQIVDIIKPRVVGFKIIDAPVCEALYNRLIKLIPPSANSTLIKVVLIKYNNIEYSFYFHVKRKHLRKHLSEEIMFYSHIYSDIIRNNEMTHIYFDLRKIDNKVEAIFNYGSLRYYKNIAPQLLKLALLELV
jgi:hypothetical protein